MSSQYPSAAEDIRQASAIENPCKGETARERKKDGEQGEKDFRRVEREKEMEILCRHCEDGMKEIDGQSVGTYIVKDGDAVTVGKFAVKPKKEGDAAVGGEKHGEISPVMKLRHGGKGDKQED